MIYTKHQTGSKKRFAWIYQSKRWKALRAKLLNERGAQCERCYSIGADGEIQVHHRIPVSLGGDIWDESNLIVLCRSCHLEAHREIEKRKLPDWQRRLYELVDKPVVGRLQYLTHTTPRRA